MIYGLYSIRDSKVGFMSVTTDTNDYTARRNFENACSRSGSLFDSHPNDFDLYLVGHFDSDSGEIQPENPPKFICAAVSKGE